jgi:hypothetical protein
MIMNVEQNKRMCIAAISIDTRQTTQGPVSDSVADPDPDVWDRIRILALINDLI